MKTEKTILITGATTGIGRHAALYLARRGHQVIATGRNAQALQALETEAEGMDLETVILDVTDASSIATAVARVDALTAGRGIDVLINNAGYGLAGPLEVISDAELKAQFETNVFGLMAVTRAFVPAMHRRGRGRILNVSSMGGRFTFPLLGAYHATKYAVEALSDALRIELRPFGIDVVLIEPGPIQSEFSGRAMSSVPRERLAHSPYSPVLERAESQRQRSDALAASPAVVSRAMARAIESRRPRARYVVPFQARILIALFTLLPTRMVDGLMRRIAGLTPEALALQGGEPARIEA